MRFLIPSLLLSTGLVLAGLFWWRPAPEVLVITPINWAEAYEKQHTPSTPLFGGAMEYARALKRSSQKHQPLTEFIRSSLGTDVVRLNDRSWLIWYEDFFGTNKVSESTPSYFNPDDISAVKSTTDNGYLEIQAEHSIHHLRYSRLETSDLHRADSIPWSVEFPYRCQAMILLAAILIFLVYRRFRPAPSDPMGHSSAGKGCQVFCFILIIGLALSALPFLYYGGEAGFAALFVGGFIVLAGITGLTLFGIQAKTLHQIIDGRDLLAHWTYTLEAWQQFAATELERQRSLRLGLLAFISLIILVVGGGFALAMADDAGLWVFYFLLALIGLLWGIAVIPPWLTYRRNMKGPGEVWIGSKGLSINGTVHTWNLPGSRFESVEYIPGRLPVLNLVYSYLMMAGRSLYFFRQKASVHVPVPEGREEEAKRMEDRLSTKASWTKT